MSLSDIDADLSVLETVMSIPFLRSHAAPRCAPEGTCDCSAPLHGGGGVPQPLHRPLLSPLSWSGPSLCVKNAMSKLEHSEYLLLHADSTASRKCCG